MLRAIAVILVMQILGEATTRASGLPVPGPVAGLVLFFLFLSITGGPSDELERTGNGLLSVLALLFVPAGVGVIAHLDLLRGDALAVTLALTLGTGIAIAAVALLFARLAGRRAP